jgi:hypothetical protein
MMIGVYAQVCFALVFFHASSTHAALGFLCDVGGAHGVGGVGSLLEGSLAFALFPIVWFMPNTQQILGQENSTGFPVPGPAAPTTIAHEQAPSLFPRVRWSPSIGWGIFMAALFFAVLVQLDPHAAFLYFQF